MPSVGSWPSDQVSHALLARISIFINFFFKKEGKHLLSASEGELLKDKYYALFIFPFMPLVTLCLTLGNCWMNNEWTQWKILERSPDWAGVWTLICTIPKSYLRKGNFCQLSIFWGLCENICAFSDETWKNCHGNLIFIVRFWLIEVKSMWN